MESSEEEGAHLEQPLVSKALPTVTPSLERVTHDMSTQTSISMGKLVLAHAENAHLWRMEERVAALLRIPTPHLPRRCLDTSSSSTFLLHLLELQVSDNSNREPTHQPTYHHLH